MSTATLSRLALEEVKIAALASGVRIAPAVLEQLGGTQHLTVHEYATTGGITLLLGEDVYVNAPFDEPFCAASPLELVHGADGALVLRLGELTVEVVTVLPLPGYLSARDPRGRLVAETTMSHADRIRVSPLVGCVYDCAFCDLAPLRYQPREAEQILAGIDVALRDDALPPRHLLISGGSPARGQRHQDGFEAVCRAVVEHVQRVAGHDFEVDVMMSARPDGPAFVDRMVDAGVHGFALNVEVFSEAHAARQLPLKHKFARPHLGPMIARAVERLGWGNGRVRSLIIPGLEPVENTLAGVEWLASLGCSPAISPFRPARGTALEGAAPVSAEALKAVLAGARESARRHGVLLAPTCVPCQHNTLTFPWDVAVC
ncbi:hypothetical protein DVA67_020420 [Solirubrobacter sp. CPCC 204708]|uniref:Radical SAM core domain-containing protein n=1 Tax=Solirubrobacter deserti TaxID=2282478 RepID=A0ABT4RNI2_9ACTN|nr:hypothetical protein [Solirubrobacter deserti]MBE2318358.1 hypothetical protein [Solirubrobacter deserti]MDA0140122.1 hypothetical protein [Solirubrobacter deserti]